MNAYEGTIEVICGPMFCGKSEELIRRVRRATIAHQRVAVFKPDIDNRYALNAVMSHSKVSVTALSVHNLTALMEVVHSSHDPEVVAIDEAQFLGDDLAARCNILANEGRRVLVAGLDMDYEGKPFDNMAELMARAEEVTKLSAICLACGEPATRSFRKTAGTERVEIGDAKVYEARCRKCHVKGQIDERC